MVHLGHQVPGSMLRLVSKYLLDLQLRLGGFAIWHRLGKDRGHGGQLSALVVLLLLRALFI
jgi:hypothetical protein